MLADDLLEMTFLLETGPSTQCLLLREAPSVIGGTRIWFACPNCAQTVGILHLPPGGSEFACRRCHNLTYRSCQESHRYDRAIRKTAKMLRLDYEELRPVVPNMDILVKEMLLIE